MKSWDLRLGDYRIVLADVEHVDAVICDPPYGARTHGGQRYGRRHAQPSADGDWASGRGLGYEPWTAHEVFTFCDQWVPRCSGWFAIFSCSDLAPLWRQALQRELYAFAPIAVVQRGMNVRLAGDGPSSWTTWLTVARPRSLRHWGTLPGAYVGNPFDPGQNTTTATRRSSVVGSKPLWLMRAIVRDYSRPGDIVCDPCAGGGTTLLAAVTEGRRAIGAEIDPETHSKATKRLQAGYTPDMFAEAR